MSVSADSILPFVPLVTWLSVLQAFDEYYQPSLTSHQTRRIELLRFFSRFFLALILENFSKNVPSANNSNSYDRICGESNRSPLH